MLDGDGAISSALRVSVTPAQTAFFAGEPLAVTITITNTHPPPGLYDTPLPTPRVDGSPNPTHARSHSAALSSTRHSHKRSAHSVTSVPMAHPPTSPGLGQIRHSSSNSLSSAPFASSSKVHVEDVMEIRRKGLVGKGARGKKAANGDAGGGGGAGGKEKGLSVEVVRAQAPNGNGKNAIFRGVRDEVRFAAPSSPRISSPLARATAVPANHPHARKSSVGVLDGAPIASSAPSTPSATPSASTSSFNASLDSIAESPNSSYKSSHFPSPGNSPNPSAMPSPMPYQYLQASANQLKTSVSAPDRTDFPSSPRTASYLEGPKERLGHSRAQAALGRGLPTQPHTAAVSTFPHSPAFVPQAEGSELILYAYVSLSGLVALAPPSAPSDAWADTLRRMRVRRQVRGGGSMDIAVMSPQLADRPKHSRRASLSGGLWGLLSPGPASPPAAEPDARPGMGARTRSMTAGAHFVPPRARGIGLGVQGVGGMERDDGDGEAPLSIFEVPNAMLGIDIRLKPGESKTWTYNVVLPDWLPPTYTGRAVQFSYQLTVGACRALPGGSNSQVMKVPVRLYNHVSVDDPTVPFDLMRRVENGVSAKLVEKDTNSRIKTPATATPSLAPTGSVSSLRAYAAQLLSPAYPPAQAADADPERDAAQGMSGCREAVEILTRIPRRITYDVHKDGVKVGVLTFMKAAWRLGETIQGVVDLNDRLGRVRVLKLSAYLEAHESLPGKLATGAADAKHMRRVHAEHHASLLECTLRTEFALDIPSDAAPAFSLSLNDDAPKDNGKPGLSIQTTAPVRGGVEWRVRVCLLVCVAPRGAQIRGAIRATEGGEWGAPYVPLRSPLCRRPASAAAVRASTDSTASWGSWIASALFTPATPAAERRLHDGDADADDEEESSADDARPEHAGWEEMRVELVECEVPVRVWPGNTAFRPQDVVFDV